jgi:hypothetical protein
MARPLTLTVVGSAEKDTGNVKVGTASYLGPGGSGHYVKVTNDGSLELKGDFTIEAWVYANSGTANLSWFANNISSGSARLFCQWKETPANDNTFRFAVGGGNIYSSTQSTDAWYHLALVRSGSTVTAYLNGTSFGSLTYSGSVGNSSVDYLIGALRTSDGLQAWDGNIDELRISSTARYTSNFTAPTTAHTNDADTILLVHMDGTDGATDFTDDSPSREDYVITAYGDAQVDTANKQFGTGSALFDGTGDVIHVDSMDKGNISTAITVEFWFKASDPGNTLTAQLVNNRTGGFGLRSWQILYRNNEQKIWFTWRGSNGTNSQNVYSTIGDCPFIAYDTWNHFAWCYNGLDKTSLYLNGTRFWTLDHTYDDYEYGLNDIFVGGYGTTGGDPFNRGANGWIDELRVSDIDRYGVNNTSFTVPTAEFTDDVDTLLLMHMNGADGSTTFEDDLPSTGTTHEGAATLSSSATSSIDVGRIRDGAASIGGAMSATISATISKNGSVDMSSSATMSIDAERTRSSEVTLSNIVNLSLQGVRIQPGASSLSTSATISITADRTRNVDSSLAVSFDQSATATRIKPLDASLAGAFNATMTAVASLNGSIDVLSSASITTDATKIHPGSATLASQSTLTSQPGFSLDSSASLSSAFTQTAEVLAYELRPNPYERPINLNTPPYTFSTTAQQGTHSLELVSGNNEQSVTSDAFAFGSSEDFLIDFYFRMSNNTQQSSTQDILKFTATNSLDKAWKIRTNKTTGDINSISFIYGGGEGTGTSYTATETKTAGYPANTWIRVTAKRVGSTISLETNQSYNTRTTASYSGAVDAPDNNILILVSNATDNNSMYMDQLRVVRGSSTYTNPTHTSTVVEYLFDNDALDNWYITHQGAFSKTAIFTQTASIGTTAGINANLNSAASISANVGLLLDTSATLNANAAITADVGVVNSADSALNATFTQIATVEVIKGGASSLNSVFAQNVTIERIVGADSTLSSAATLSATATRIQEVAADFDAIVSQVTAVGRIAGFILEPDSAFTQTTAINATFDHSATLDSACTISASADRIRTDSATLQSASTLSIDFTVIEPGGAILSSAFAQTVDATRIHPGSATLSSAFTVAAEIEKGLELIELLAGEFQQTASADRIRNPGYANYQSEFTQLADTRKIVPGAATLDSAMDFVLDADFTVDNSINLSTSASLSADINVVRGGAADLAVEFDQTANVNRSTTGAIQFDVAFTQNTNAGFVANASATLDGAMSFTIIYKVLHLEQYVYTIPKENRTFTIDSESRSFTVHKETRAYTIQGD